jgi:hypothetical protein
MSCGKRHFSFCDLRNFVACIFFHIFSFSWPVYRLHLATWLSCWPVHMYVYLKQCQQSCFLSRFLGFFVNEIRTLATMYRFCLLGDATLGRLEPLNLNCMNKLVPSYSTRFQDFFSHWTSCPSHGIIFCYWPTITDVQEWHKSKLPCSIIFQVLCLIHCRAILNWRTLVGFQACI